jgi:superkiller protein 3
MKRYRLGILFFLASRVVLAQHPISHPASSQSQATKTKKLPNPLNDLLDQAQAAIDKNDFEAAIPPLQKFLAEKPDVAFAHFQLGYVFTALKKNDEARAEYERAVTLDPKTAEAWLNLGLLVMDSDPTGAVKALKKAVELLPAQSRPRFLLGIAQERAGDLKGATESLEGATHLDPNDLETRARLANIYLQQKQYKEAENESRAALNIDPKQPAALQGLAQSLDAQNKPGAEDAYRTYLEVQPQDEAARERLIHILLDKKLYNEALAELDRFEASQRPNVSRLKMRADIQIAEGQLDAAIATLRRAIAENPKDSALLAGLGRMYLQKHDFTNAENELKAAIQLESTNLAYWKDLSSAYYLQGNCPAALATLEVIAKHETPGAAVWFIRALCYDKLGQTDLALEAYQNFLGLDQNKDPDQVWQAEQRSKILRRKQQKR